ncbi:succinate dehydrogenase/fumarate reductase iron-sulfur subunit [bacterium]|nr:MAG: succinate dehydrogenase/fumarate reductase iron-sulfur subunit [bacterium]
MSDSTTTDEKVLQLVVNRGEAGDERGQDVTYEIPRVKGMVVLDAVLYAQGHQDQDLAVRWNCKAGKCGSCAAEINGYPRLLCKTRVEDLPADKPVRVQPMQTFTRIKDLVTDVSWNYEMNKQIPPFTPREDKEWRWQQRDVERAQEMRKCIECFLCQDVCHVIRYQRSNKPKFAGPRFFVRTAGLDYHPMDALDRAEFLKKEAGIEMCNVTRCCTDVCPEHIQITDNAIIPAKERIVDQFHDPVKKAVKGT